MSNKTIGFIGFGLIAGSIAHAIKEKHPGYTLISYNHRKSNADKEQAGTPISNGRNGISEALKDNVLTYVYDDLEEGFSTCDIIFLCAPVLTNITYLSKLRGIIKPDCILTDVGSVKGNIHAAVDELKLNQHFIGGHPMAGSEKTGYQNSSSKIMENAYYILTPTKEVPNEMVTTLFQLVKDMNAIPLVLDAKEHDDITAAISHVPHIIAAALVNAVKNADGPEEKMRLLAAGGFKDITRIASSSPEMWQNICLTNPVSIKHFLSQYITSLQKMLKAIDEENADYIYQCFDTASEYRNSIPNKSIGIMNKEYVIYLDIADETGAISTIATLLASNSINIKNIGIIHNREFEEGVLRIEFYEEDTSAKAVDLLKNCGYTVYQR